MGTRSPDEQPEGKTPQPRPSPAVPKVQFACLLTIVTIAAIDAFGPGWDAPLELYLIVGAIALGLSPDTIKAITGRP